MSNRHAFISYCRENKRHVNKVHDDLVRRGFSVWWDDHLLGGQNWKFGKRAPAPWGAGRGWRRAVRRVWAAA